MMGPNPHPEDAELFDRLKAAAFAVAEAEGLPLKVFEHKRRGGGSYGVCYVSEGRIAIEFRDRHVPGQAWRDHPHPVEVIEDTVAHELAHLRIANHGPAHRALTASLLLAVRGHA